MIARRSPAVASISARASSAWPADNGYRSNFGLRFDTSYGRKVDAYAAYYRTESIDVAGAWSNPESLSFQNSAYTSSGDDFLLAGLEYHSGEGTLPGHDYKTVVRMDVAPNGYGAERYVGISGNMQLPWFSNTFLTGLRGEWVYVMNNVSDMDPDADLGLTPYSFIFELDVYNTARTRVSAAVAQMAQVEGLPVLANVDNDPFSEWDFTVNNAADAFNLSREGKNYFPADFFGFGLRAEHTFGNSLYSSLSFYDGQRVDAAASERPGMARLNLGLSRYQQLELPASISSPPGSGRVSKTRSPWCGVNTRSTSRGSPLNQETTGLASGRFSLQRGALTTGFHRDMVSRLPDPG